MITFSTKILRFGKKGEKTGWRYVAISRRQAEQLKPGSRVSFRIKGLLDHHQIQKTALVPMGDGKFILPVNGSIRNAIGKDDGDTIRVQLELDARELTASADFMKCLKDDSRAYDYFKTLPKYHQHYISQWIESAKTISTKTKRITMAVIALGSGQGFREMLRANRNWG